MQFSRDGIIRCVWLAGLFLVGCAVFGSLWSGLQSLGDVQGATFCQGVFWGFVICSGLNGITLMGLITAQVIGQNQGEENSLNNAFSSDHPSPSQNPLG